MKYFFLVILSALSGALLLYISSYKKPVENSVIYEPRILRQIVKQTDHTKNVLYIEEEAESEKYSPLKEEISEYLLKSKQQKEASVYFYNFEDGSWFGINENQKIIPSSLTKLLLTVAFYKAQEANPNLITETVRYENEYIEHENIDANSRLKKGETYSYQDLIKQMIYYSDNEAFFLTFEKLSEDYPDIVLNVQEIFNLDFVNLIDIKNYSGLFKTLYFSSYLSSSNSEKIIEMLANQEFDKGIVTPLAKKEITVAHKYGFLNPSARQVGSTKHFVHCGIVYLNPDYLLCVSLNAPNNKPEQDEILATTAEKISEIILNGIQNQ